MATSIRSASCGSGRTCGWRRRRTPRPTAAGAGGPTARAPARTSRRRRRCATGRAGSVPAQTTSGSCGPGGDLPDAGQRPGVLGEGDRRGVGPLVPAGAQVVGAQHRRAPVLGAEPRDSRTPSAGAPRRCWAPRSSGTAAPRPPSPAGCRCAPARAPCASPPPPLCSSWWSAAVSHRQPQRLIRRGADLGLVRTASPSARTAPAPTTLRSGSPRTRAVSCSRTRATARGAKALASPPTCGLTSTPGAAPQGVVVGQRLGVGDVQRRQTRPVAVASRRASVSTTLPRATLTRSAPSGMAPGSRGRPGRWSPR